MLSSLPAFISHFGLRQRNRDGAKRPVKPWEMEGGERSVQQVESSHGFAPIFSVHNLAIDANAT